MIINDLILEYKSLSEVLAKKKSRKLKLDDEKTEILISAAYYGLVYAANRYRVIKEVQFRTYAYKIIEIFIKNEVREIFSMKRLKSGEMVIPTFYSLDDEHDDENSEINYKTFLIDDSFKYIDEKLNLKVSIAFANLSDNERFVILEFLKDKSFTQIGKEQNLSKERIRQIFDSAIIQIKNYIDGKIFVENNNKVHNDYKSRKEFKLTRSLN